MAYFFICLGANVLGFIGVLFGPPSWLGWLSSVVAPVLFVLNVGLLFSALRYRG